MQLKSSLAKFSGSVVSLTKFSKLLALPLSLTIAFSVGQAQNLSIREAKSGEIPRPVEAYSDLNSWWGQGKDHFWLASDNLDSPSESQVNVQRAIASREALIEIEVEPSGSLTIQQALDQVVSGGRIILKNGEYAERIRIDKPVTILGDGEVTITSPNDETIGSVVSIRSSGVTLENMTITGARGTGRNGAGVRVSGADISQLKFENVNASQNLGDGFAFIVSGKYSAIEFLGTNARLNEGFGIGFYGGTAISGRNHELSDILFEGNRDDRGVVAFNEAGGISIRLGSGAQELRHQIGNIIFRDAVLETNYGVSQLIIQGLTHPLTFEGCWFNGGLFRGFDTSQPLPILVPSSQYAIILMGALKQEFYTPIPEVNFIANSQGQVNQFDGIYWFGVLNWIGWSDLAGVQFGESSGSGGVGLVPAVEVGATLQGEDLSDSTALLKTGGAQGNLDLSGLLMDSNRNARFDLLMGGQPFSEDPANPAPTTVAVDAKGMLFETASGDIKTIEEMTLEERFEQSSRMVTQYNPSVRNSTALGSIEMVESGDVYIVPSPGNSIQQILERVPEGSSVYVQRGNYPDDTTLNINRGLKVFFQGGLNAGGSSGTGVNIPGLSPEDISIDTGAETVEFETPSAPGLTQVEGIVYLDTNRNGTLEPGDGRLQGAVVYLDDNRNGQLDEGEISVISGADGAYLLPVVNLGIRDIVLDLPEGFAAELPTGGSYTESLIAGDNLEDRNFLQAGVGHISGVAWEDLNGDSVRDSTEPELSGLGIVLNRLSDTGQSIESLRTLTDESGVFLFERLFSGNYSFRKPVPADWILTQAPGDEGRVVSVGATPLENQDFGAFQLAAISGSIYEDENKNGVLDEGERLVSGATVSLDMQRDGSLEAFRITNESGVFHFTALESQPLSVFSLLPSLPAGSERLESELDFEITQSGQVIDDAIVGFFNPARVSGEVILQAGSDIGPAGSISVSLVDSSSGEIVDTTISALDGTFELRSSQPGEFSIQAGPLPANTRTITLPEGINLVSGSTISGQTVELALNLNPILESQTFTGTPELSPAGTVVGIIEAEDPEAGAMTFEIVSGNQIENAALRAWAFRDQLESLFDVTTTRVFETAPPIDAGKLLQGIRSVDGVNQVELYWLTENGGLFANVYPVQGIPDADADLLGEKLVQLDGSYYNNPDLLIEAFERPEGLFPFELDAATGHLALATNTLMRSQQPDGGFRLVIRVTDELGASAEGEITVDLLPANLAPAFIQNNWTREIAEASESGVSVGEPIIAEDPESQVLTYSITSQQDTLDRLIELDKIHKFQDPTGGVYSFNARGAGDKWLHGSRTRQWFYLVLDPTTRRAELYEAPKDAGRTLQLVAAGVEPLVELSDTFYEDPSLLVGIANTDPNPDAFAIDSSTGQIRVVNPQSLNPLFNPYIYLTIQVEDAGMPQLSAETEVIVRIVPTLDFPGISRFTNLRILENSPAGTRIGQLAASDPQGEEDLERFEIRYDDSGPGSESFRIDADTGELFVADGATLDFENQIFYELRVRVTDRSQRWAEGRVIVDLINVDEPAFLNVGNGLISEGNAGSKLLEIPVNLTAGFAQNIFLSYDIQSGTAAEGIDFEDASPVPGRAVIIPGDQSTHLRFNIFGDTELEADETFTVTVELAPDAPDLLSINQGDGTGTIIDDDRPRVLDNGRPGFSAIGSGWNSRTANGAYNQNLLFDESTTSSANWTFEGLEPGKYRVSVSSPALRAVGFYSVWDESRQLAAEVRQETYTWAGGLGTDFRDEEDDSIFWNDLGVYESTSGNLQVRLKNKLETAGLTQRIKLADAVRVEPVDQSPAKIFINDPFPVLYGADAVVQLELNGPVDETISVEYSIIDPNGALNDLNERSGTLVMEAGSDGAQLNLSTVNFENPGLEDERQYTVRLGPVTQGYATIVNHSAVGRVVPEELMNPQLDLLGPSSVSESTTAIPMIARLNFPASELIETRWQVGEVSESGEIGSVISSGELSFAVGIREALFEIPALDNDTPDLPNRRMVVWLTPRTPSQVISGDTSRIVELEDDDGPIIVDAPDLNFGQAIYTETNLRSGISDWSDFNTGYGGVSRMIQGNISEPGATAIGQWKVFGLVPGAFYRVSATWPGNSSFTRQAPFRIYQDDEATGDLDWVGGAFLDQSLSPDDFVTDELGRLTEQGSVYWEDVGFFRAETEDWRIQVSNNVQGVVVADAVRIERVFIPVVETIPNQTSEAGVPLEALVQLGHSDPERNLEDVEIQSVRSSSELIVPNTIRSGAGITWEPVSREQGIWRVRIQPMGIRTGLVNFTVRITDGETPVETEFSVVFQRTNFLFDFGVSGLVETPDTPFIAISKSSLYRSSMQYGWIVNRGLSVDSTEAADLALKDAVTGPVAVDFKLGGLPAGDSFEIDLLLGRDNDSLASGTLVQAIGRDENVVDSASFYYTVSEKPDSLRKVSLVATANSDGELIIRFSPYRPVTAQAGLRFAITAMQVRPLGAESVSAWESKLLAANLNGNLASANQTMTPPNPGIGLQSRVGGGGEITSMPAALWLDDGGVSFTASEGWDSIDGFGFESGLHYFASSSADETADVASWTFMNLESGIYRLAAHWEEGVNRSEQVRVRVRHQDEVYGPFVLNQKQAPEDFQKHGTNWDWVGDQEFFVAFDSFSPGTEREDGSLIPQDYNHFVVEILPSADGVTVADAVLLEAVGVEQIIASPPAELEVVEGNTIGTDLLVEVNLSTAPLDFVSLDYQVIAGSATGGVDVELGEGSLIFGPGQIVSQMLVPIFGDTRIEGDETFIIEWSNSIGVDLTRTETPVLIIDDDGGRSVQPLSDSVSVLEARIEGAMVWRDTDLNGSLDPFESVATSDSNGVAQFAILESRLNSPLRASGGIDRATGDPMIYPLSAPQSATTIHSLTTLLQSLVDEYPTIDLVEHVEKLQNVFGIDAAISVLNQNARAAFQVGFSESAARVLIAQTLIESRILGLGSFRLGQMTGGFSDQESAWRVLSNDIFKAVARLIEETPIGASSWLWADPDWNLDFLNQIFFELGWELDSSDIQALAQALADQAAFLDTIMMNELALEEEDQRVQALAQLSQFRAYLKRDWKGSLAALGRGEVSSADWMDAHSGAAMESLILTQSTLNPVGQNLSPGRISLIVREYAAYESELRIGVEVNRTGGSLGAVSGVLQPFSGQAELGVDVLSDPVTFSFSSGEAGSKIVYLGILDDDEAEENEEFFIELVSVSGGAALDVPVRIAATILDDDSDSAAISVRLRPEFNAGQNMMTLAWPEFLDGFSELQSLDGFGDTGGWRSVLKDGSVVLFGIRHLTVPIEAEGSRFYRLLIEPPALGMRNINGVATIVCPTVGDGMVLEMLDLSNPEAGWIPVPVSPGDKVKDEAKQAWLIPVPPGSEGRLFRLRGEMEEF